MTNSTYAIVHIPDNTPELAPDALGAHVTIRTRSHPAECTCDDCAWWRRPLVPCTGGCGELVPDTIYGDPYCDDCALALVPEDVRAMQAAPSGLARDIAALPDNAYATFWNRLLHEYLADPLATDADIDALQDAFDDFAQDRSPNPCPPLSLAPAGPAAHPTRLAG